MVGGQKPPRPGAGEKGGEREPASSKKVTQSKKSSERVVPGRPDLVGRRFLSVTGTSTPRLSKLYEWDWRAGWIRSTNSKDPKSKDLQVGFGKCKFFLETWEENGRRPNKENYLYLSIKSHL